MLHGFVRLPVPAHFTVLLRLGFRHVLLRVCRPEPQVTEQPLHLDHHDQPVSPASCNKNQSEYELNVVCCGGSVEIQIEI